MRIKSVDKYFRTMKEMRRNRRSIVAVDDRSKKIIIIKMKTLKLFFLFLIFNLAFHISGITQNPVNTSQVNKTGNNNGDEDKDFSNKLDKGKQRDQQAIDEAINGWWTASMKNHDQRIAWWRNAKFGMFIHWGVYSQAGSR